VSFRRDTVGNFARVPGIETTYFARVSPNFDDAIVNNLFALP